MQTLSNAERETHLNLVADNREMWEVFSDDPVMIARLDKIVTAYKTQDGGKFYRLPANQLTIRKAKKPMSDEERKRAAARLAKIRTDSI